MQKVGNRVMAPAVKDIFKHFETISIPSITTNTSLHRYLSPPPPRGVLQAKVLALLVQMINLIILTYTKIHCVCNILAHIYPLKICIGGVENSEHRTRFKDGGDGRNRNCFKMFEYIFHCRCHNPVPHFLHMTPNSCLQLCEIFLLFLQALVQNILQRVGITINIHSCIMIQIGIYIDILT